MHKYCIYIISLPSFPSNFSYALSTSLKFTSSSSAAVITHIDRKQPTEFV